MSVLQEGQVRKEECKMGKTTFRYKVSRKCKTFISSTPARGYVPGREQEVKLIRKASVLPLRELLNLARSNSIVIVVEMVKL